MGEIVAIIILGVVVIAQAAERYYFAREMNDRVSQAVKAVMSRNINEYISATQAEKPAASQFTETDEVFLSEASDEEFDKHIEQQTK